MVWWHGGQVTETRGAGVRSSGNEVLRCGRDGLASHAVAGAVLSGAALGHDPVRDGTGWSQGALGHAHT